MPKFMKVDTALRRLAEDAAAPLNARCDALRQIQRPQLSMLRRLLVNSSQAKPVPARLKAIAALRYAHEIQLRKIRPRKTAQQAHDNALGID